MNSNIDNMTIARPVTGLGVEPRVIMLLASSCYDLSPCRYVASRVILRDVASIFTVFTNSLFGWWLLSDRDLL